MPNNNFSDAGVRCLPHDDVCTVNDSSPTEMITMADTPSTDSTCPQTTPISEPALKSISKTLGVLTGLLAAALVVVSVGWIVSCVYWQRRITQR